MISAVLMAMVVGVVVAMLVVAGTTILARADQLAQTQRVVRHWTWPMRAGMVRALSHLNRSDHPR